MRICIVTVYNNLNCGSFWQAFVLGKYLEKKGNEVFYYTTFVKDSLELYKEKSREVLGALKRRDFHYLKDLFKKYKLIKDDLVEFKKIDNRGVSSIDCFILGSDTIWNFDKKRFYNNREIFLGSFVPDGIKIFSYAASFANTSLEKVSSIVDINNSFKRMNKISVRDKRSFDIIKELTGKKCDIVCDPTLLYNKKDYKDIVGEKIEKSNYILLYLFKKMSNEQLNIVKEYALKNDLDIIEINNNTTHNGVKSTLKEPINFLNHFYYADMIFTDTFHGVMFSVNFEREFFAINRNKNKVNEFLEENEFSDRLIENDFDNSIFSKKKVDYDSKYKLIEFRKKSKEFIDSNILGGK